MRAATAFKLPGPLCEDGEVICGLCMLGPLEPGRGGGEADRSRCRRLSCCSFLCRLDPSVSLLDLQHKRLPE